jgi:hypothetical protein
MPDKGPDAGPDAGAGQHCPICGTPVTPYPRYPKYLCSDCAARAVTPDGRALVFHNIDASGGYMALHADTREPYESHLVHVGAVACYADEARFGGIVIQPIEGTS